MTPAGDGFLVAWTRVKGKDWGIGLRRISPDGTREPIAIRSTTELYQHEPVLDWAGGFATLSWTIDAECPDCEGDVVATRLSETGESLDAEPMRVTETFFDEAIRAAASTGHGCSALVYERWDDPPGVLRAFVRTFGTC